jgi:hypothetical protein
MSVFEEMFESIEHRLCLRHLYANFKKKFGGGTLIRDLMMGAAKATYFQAWKAKMDELKKVDVGAWEWLMLHPTKSWSKHAFSYYPKCDILMNNLTESFNATILVARDKPFLSMCEWIRTYLMNRIGTARIKLDRWQHNIMPMPRKRLDKEVFLSGQWTPSLSVGDEWQVIHHYGDQQFIVDTAKRTCSCGFWELVGIPCRHAVAALSYRKQNPSDFVDHYYSRSKYIECYSFGVSPINGMEMWPEVDIEEPLPPHYKRGAGRPKKLRIREVDELGTRMRRPGVSYRCTKCDKFGHNYRRCKSTIQDPNAAKRKVYYFNLFKSTLC